MCKNKAIIVIIFLFFIFSVSSCVKKASVGNTSQSEKTGIVEQKEFFAGNEIAPDFNLPSLKGEILKLSSFKGDVVILNFWATWCPPCRAEIPDFIKLYNNYKNKGLMIIGLSLDKGESDKVKSFCEKMGITYPIAISSDEVIKAYGSIRYIPTTFIIDREGKIAKKYTGYTDSKVFEADIEKLL